MLFNFINVSPNMIVILIISLITVVNSLETKSNNEINDGDVKAIIGKYLKKVPDIESRYVLNDKLSSVINHYFKGKISALPLYKISLKIDRNPVKIPWTLDLVEKQKGDTVQSDESTAKQDTINKPVRHYRVMKASSLPSSSEMPDATTMPTKSTVAPPI